MILENGADNQKQDINQDSKIKKQFIKADDTSMPEQTSTIDDSF